MVYCIQMQMFVNKLFRFVEVKPAEVYECNGRLNLVVGSDFVAARITE